MNGADFQSIRLGVAENMTGDMLRRPHRRCHFVDHRHPRTPGAPQRFTYQNHRPDSAFHTPGTAGHQVFAVQVGKARCGDTAGQGVLGVGLHDINQVPLGGDRPGSAAGAPWRCLILGNAPRHQPGISTIPENHIARGRFKRTLYLLPREQDAPLRIQAVDAGLDQKLHAGFPDAVSQVVIRGHRVLRVIFNAVLLNYPAQVGHENTKVKVALRANRPG